MPAIVTVNVNQTIAPTPDTLQKTGALISQGGTSIGAQNIALLTQLSDLAPLLAAALALTSLAWATNVATATTAVAHGITNGDTFITTIAGATPVVYNGTFLATATGANTFTYSLPGTALTTPATGSITYTPRGESEIQAMANTFFAQGAQQAVYVLELGAGEPAAGVTALTTFETNNPGFFYGYLVPRSWDGVSSFLTYLAGFESTTSKKYFWVTTTSATYTDYTALMKDVIALDEAPLTPVTEFSLAGPFRDALNYAPSTTNKVTPFAFSFLFGVTPYPTKGNGAYLQTLATAKVNVVGTGAEGGISDAILVNGTTMDGRDFTYWYSVDWMQINVQQSVANAVINGSNNPINPLYYNQDGINRLQQAAARTASSAVTFGLAIGTVIQTALDGAALTLALENGDFAGKLVVNAVPFIPYSVANPSHYKIGEYDGLSIIYVPARGFVHLVFNIQVTDFVTQ